VNFGPQLRLVAKTAFWSIVESFRISSITWRSPNGTRSRFVTRSAGSRRLFENGCEKSGVLYPKTWG